MSMYHLTDSGMWSSLYLLADAAVMVEEEEQRLRRLLGDKIVFEEDKSQKRFFHLFPRKTRSSLVKRRYTQQNPNASSSLLPDLNLIPTDSVNPQNPSSGEEERAKKGKSKLVFEEDEHGESKKRLFEKNLKKFATRRFSQQSYVNLNGASTSSSFLNLRCFESSSIFTYNTAEDESEKTETKDLPNPSYQSSSPSSCVTDNRSRKRRAVEQRKSKTGFKKAKVASLPRNDTETPQWVFEVMRKMNADAVNPRLIFVRTLSASDVKSSLSRLLIPFQQLICNDFLTPAESRAIEKVESNEVDKENIGVGTILVNQRSEKWGLRFKIWPMEKDSGHGTLNYALNWGWNEVVKGNDLKVNDKISLWTFRCRGVLCFALES